MCRIEKHGMGKKRRCAMLSDALKLPRINISEREQEKMTDVLNELSSAKAVVMFYENQKGEYKFLFTDLDQMEFEMMFMEIHRHVQVSEFFKTLIERIEEVRKDFAKTNELIIKGVDYIRLKKSIEKPINPKT